MSVTIYRASAGSGKTHTLTHSFVRQLLSQENPLAYLHQLAITFTRKATEEMKRRILELLGELSRPLEDERGVQAREKFLNESFLFAVDKEESGKVWSGGSEALQKRAAMLQNAILHDYGRFSIYTIDAFFQRVVRSFLWEAGFPPSYSVELDTKRLLQEAIEQVVEEVSSHEQNRKWIGAILSERIQEGSRWNIQDAFAEVGDQVLNERFFALGLPFIEQLCNKEFLKSYMLELRSWEGNFKERMEGFASEVLSLLKKEELCTTDFMRKNNSFMCYFDKIKDGNYVSPPDSLRNALDDPSKWSAKNDPLSPQITSIFPLLNRLVKECVAYYDTHAPLWLSIQLALQSLPQMGLAADVLRHTRNLLSNDNTVHLSQTLQLLSTLATHQDAPFILERMGCRYSNFLLDEFQDTSVLQWQVLLPLVHNGLAQGGSSLVVGDVKQSIYRWRNSDLRILGGGVSRDLQQYLPKDEILRTNWRSREVLVNNVGDILEQVVESVYQKFLSDLPPVSSPEEEALYREIPYRIKEAYADIRQQISLSKMGSGGYMTITSIEPPEGQKAQELVLDRLPRMIIELQNRGFSASDIAILVRKNSEGQQIASTLMSFKEQPEAKGFCFDVVSPDSLHIRHSPEVQLLIAIFKRFVTPHDEINKRLIEQLSAQLHTMCPDSLWTGTLPQKALPEAFEEVLRILKWTDRHSAFLYIQELHSQILTFSNSRGHQTADVFSFVRWWSQNGSKISLKLDSSGNAIKVISIHQSKGLEYPVVIIPFCNWELGYASAHEPLLWISTQRSMEHAPLNKLPFVPQRHGSKMAKSLFAFDYYYEKMQRYIDQLNVFYVAATRAKEELHIFLPQPPRSSFNLATLLKPSSSLFTAGSPIQKERSSSIIEGNTTSLKQYASATPSLRLKVRLADESPKIESLSPRRRGIILHQLLSRIHTQNDIDTAINELIANGMITANPDEHFQYAQIIRNALAQPEAANWFDGSWHVRTEASILLPSMGSHTIRPDRVMERDGRMLIIDYKFGEPHSSHQHQMDNYVAALKQMGVQQVEGHVWYIFH